MNASRILARLLLLIVVSLSGRVWVVRVSHERPCLGQLHTKLASHIHQLERSGDFGIGT